MTVDPATAKHRFAYKGQDYFFCSGRCRERFEAEPEKFLQPKSAMPAEDVPEGTIYTCPMHPEVRQVGPGSCPICGMALEPETISLDDKPDPELIDMTRRFWIALALTLPVFVIDMTGHFGGIHLFPPHISNWVSFASGDAGCVVGGMAVLRTGMALTGHAQSQHVHPDRHGNGRRLRLQRRGDTCAAGFPAEHFAICTARSRCISKLRR